MITALQSACCSSRGGDCCGVGAPEPAARDSTDNFAVAPLGFDGITRSFRIDVY